MRRLRNQIYKLTEIIRSQKTVVKNFSFLSILQFTQMVIGLLVYPYLIKILGTNNYGVVAYSQAIIGYAVLFTNYGFNVTATRDIARYKDNAFQKSKIFSTVLVVKFLIFILISILIIFLTYFVDFLNQYQLAYIITLIALFGWVLFPDWFFQGIEKMQNITYLMVVFKVLSVFFIFIFVNSPEDYIKAILINSISMFLIGVSGIVLVFRLNEDLQFKKPSIIRITSQMKRGFAYFFSNISASSKDYASTFIIGAFFNYSEVGIYDLIVKIVKVMQIPISIFTRAVFPKISIVKSIKFNNKIGKIMFIYGLLAFGFILLFGKIILLYLLDSGTSYYTILCFKIMAISLPLLALTSLKGTLTLVAFNYDTSFTKGIIISILFYIVLLFLLYNFNYINIVSVTLAIVGSVAIELISHLYFISKNKIENSY